MRLDGRMKLQLVLFTVIALTAVSVMTLHFMKLPVMLFGTGYYAVTMELPQTGGLYSTGNVTYRGTEVGRVQSVRLTDTGVEAVLSLKSGIDIPADLKAEVHSQSAIGEQYVALLPRSGDGPMLRDGDVIPLADTSVPPDINRLLTAANEGLQAIPHDNLQTVVDESYVAVGGLGPELSRIVRGTADLAIDARENLDPLITLIDQGGPVLDSQTETSAAISDWAAHMATVTGQLAQHDGDVGGVLTQGGPGARAVRGLLDRVRPTLPILTDNLTSAGQVAVTYQDNIEQLLVLFPQVVSAAQAGLVANVNTRQAYRGQYLSFNLNINLPPPCTTGFLPAQQQRAPTFEDYPDRAPGDLYCRVPQDSPFNVRGARNTPCETAPGKRAASVRLCESDENYVPLNDGFAWKGDPNATLSGQSIPETAPGTTGPATVVEPDTAIGGADPGNVAQQRSWEDLLLPPG